MQKPEVAAFVSLGNFFGIKFTVAPWKCGFTRFPLGFSGGEFFIADIKVKFAAFDVDLTDRNSLF